MDSMIIVQYVEEDGPGGREGEEEGEEGAEEREHLATLSFAKRRDVQRKEDHFGTLTM